MPLLQTTVHLNDAWGRPEFTGPRTLIWAEISAGTWVLVAALPPNSNS